MTHKLFPSALPDSVIDALHDDQTAQFRAGDDERIAQVGRQLAATMAQSMAQPMTQQPKAIDAAPDALTVNSTQGRWSPFLPGIERKTLMRRGPDDVAIMLRMRAGATLPVHGHARDEECVVISGRLRIGHTPTIVDAGGFHWVAQGSHHEVITAEEDTLIFLRGALDATA